jgi:hypothetical protein
MPFLNNRKAARCVKPEPLTQSIMLGRKTGTLGKAIVWIEAHGVTLVALWLVINSLGLTFTILRLQHVIR